MGETDIDAVGHGRAGRGNPVALRLLLAGAALLLGAGLLLWLREGDRLFTEGLIAAIAGCF